MFGKVQVHHDSMLNALFNTLQSVTCQSDNSYCIYLPSAKVLEQNGECLSSRNNTVEEIANLEQQREQFTKLRHLDLKEEFKEILWARTF